MIVKTAAQKLLEAQNALHQLRIGRAAVVIEVDGRKVHYKASTVEDLEAYVSDLTNEAAGVVPMRRGRAIGVLFG